MYTYHVYKRLYIELYQTSGIGEGRGFSVYPPWLKIFGKYPLLENRKLLNNFLIRPNQAKFNLNLALLKFNRAKTKLLVNIAPLGQKMPPENFGHSRCLIIRRIAVKC